MQLPFTWYTLNTCIRSADCQNSQTESRTNRLMHWLNFKRCTVFVWVVFSLRFMILNVCFVLYSLFTQPQRMISQWNGKWRYCSHYCLCEQIIYVYEWIHHEYPFHRTLNVKHLSSVYFVPFFVLFSISFFWFLEFIISSFISISLSFPYSLKLQSN